MKILAKTLKGAALAAPFSVAPALAQQLHFGGDRATAEKITAEEYVLKYENSLDRNSNTGMKMVEIDGVEIWVSVKVNNGGPEVVTVTATEGYVVMPPDPVSVEDGNTISFRIMPAMY